MATIRVLSAEGEETTWLRAAASEHTSGATALKDWIDSAADDGGAFATPVPAQALGALAYFAEQCATAAASGGEAARDAAASAWAAEKERSPAELAQLLHGAHFLEMPNARLAIGREFCARLAATGSPDELAAMLKAACDLLARDTPLWESYALVRPLRLKQQISPYFWPTSTHTRVG